MRQRQVSLIVFYDRQKHILLQDRHGIARHGEEWGFFGGEIESGETPEQALIRETGEELGVVLADYKFIGTFSSTVNNIFIERYVFVSFLEDIAALRLGEGRSMRLFSLDEAEMLKMVSGDERVIEALRKVLF